MHIEAIPMWEGTGNNYAYIVSDEDSMEAVIIDPAHALEVLPILQERMKPVSEGGQGLILKHILNTHHHADHSGGNFDLLQIYKVPIRGGPQCPHVTKTLRDTEKIDLGDRVRITAMFTPCHTQDSISYYVDDCFTGDSVVFTGDTLFNGGCGKFFEGDAKQMHDSLKLLGALPGDTLVYPGHEYTAGNADWAAHVLPDDPHIIELQDYCLNNDRTEGKFTIADELKHNLFMRVNDPVVWDAMGTDDPVQVMHNLRTHKNNH